MTIDFEGGTAVVTGSAGGIGLGIVRACIRRGMNVVLSDVDEAKLDSAVTDLVADGAGAVGQAADVRDPAQVAALRDRALSDFGRVDLICNNAGIGLTRALVHVKPSDWDIVLDINVKGLANGIAAFLPLFDEQGRGHVNSTSSLSGITADPELGVYNASKFAVIGVMEALALELADGPVSASVLCPGPVATDLLHSSAIHTGAGANEAVHAYLNQGLHPDDVGEVAMSGIAEGRFWLLTHPELTNRLMSGRTASMLDDGSLYVDPVEWIDQ